MPDPVVSIVGENQPVAGYSEGGSIDFGALKDKASAMIDAVADAPAAKAVEPVKAEPAAKAAEPAKPAEPATPEPPAAAEITAKEARELADDDLVKVVVDGEEQLVPWKDARGNISGGLKFTKNMQSLAKEKKDFEANRQLLTDLQTERQQLQNFLNDQASVLKYVQAKFPNAFQQPEAVADATDPNEIATVGQARTIAEQQMATLQRLIEEQKQSVDDRIAQATQTIEHKQQQAKHATAISSTLADIFTKNPVLKSIPDAEDILRYNVAKMQPTTEAEALDAFRAVSQGMVDEISKHFKAQQKIQAVTAAKQKLESKSIEPAAGAAPQIQPTSFKNNDGTINWKSVKQAASDYLG